MADKKCKGLFDKWAGLLLLICSIAIVFVLVMFGINQCKSSNSVPKINIVFDEPTLKSDSTLYAKEGIDSLMKMVASHEQALSDKYQYMLEQKEKDETMLSFGTILVGIVLSICGFFGFKSMKDVEARAEKIANEKSKEETQNYLDDKLKTLVGEQSKAYFESDAAAQMKKALEEYIVIKMGEVKIDICNDIAQEQKNNKADEDDLSKLQENNSENKEVILASEVVRKDVNLNDINKNDKDMEGMLG